MKLSGTRFGQPVPPREAPESSRGSGSTPGHPSGQGTSLNNLPADLQRAICGLLRGDSPYATARKMAPFLVTSRVQYDSLVQVGSPWSSQAPVASCFPDKNAVLSVLEAQLFGPVLDFLSPGQRDRLVGLVDDLPDEAARSDVIASLGRGLAHLQVSQRSALVTAALALTDKDDRRAYAIAGMVASLAHLEPSLRNDLVKAAFALPNDGAKHEVMVRLAWSLSQLSEDERDALVEAAIRLPEYGRARAIAALGAGSAFLKEDQCDALVQAAADLPKAGLMRAAEGLFKGFSGLNAAQRRTVMDSVLEAPDAALDPGWANAALQLGVEYLSGPQRERIIRAAVATLDAAPDDLLGLAIGELGPAVAHFSKPQRDAILGRAFHLAEDGRVSVLPGLCKCMAHLDQAQREALVRAAKRHPESWVIGQFGESLEHLSPAHQRALIAAATDVESICGLAKGLRHLAQPERSLLIEAAKRLENRSERTSAVVAIARATSEAQLPRERVQILHLADCIGEFKFSQPKFSQPYAAYVSRIVNMTRHRARR